MMPVHIHRNAGRHDFIPNYSTEELLLGVCHIIHVPKVSERREHKGREERISKLMEIIDDGYWLSLEVRQAKSRAKFEENKTEILQMLARGRGLCSIAKIFQIGDRALKRYLEEEEK